MTCDFTVYCYRDVCYFYQVNTKISEALELFLKPNYIEMQFFPVLLRDI